MESKIIWPNANQKIEYGFLDMDNHILYREDNKKEMKSLNNYLDSHVCDRQWITVFSNNFNQCVYAFSSDFPVMSIVLSKSSVMRTIKHMQNNDKIT